MKAFSIVVACCLATSLSSGSALASVVYDAPPDGTRLSGSVHEYGQIFSAPMSETILSEFTVRGVMGGAPTTAFNFKVAAWDSSQNMLVAPILFTSAQRQTLGTPADFTFSPNIPLSPGAQYLAFIDKADFSPNDPLSVAGSDSYPDGAWAATAYPIFQQQPWLASSTGQDLAFRAVFTPEPSALVFAVGAALLLRRRPQCRAML
jgi:hypothetical protein